MKTTPILDMLRPNENWSTDTETRQFILYLIAFKYEPIASDKVKSIAREIIGNAHMGFISQTDMENQLIDLYAQAFGRLTF